MSKMWQMVLLVSIHYIINLFLVPSLHCKCLGSKSLQPPNKRNGSNMINSNIWDSPRLMMPLDGARNCRVAATQAGMRLYEPSLHSGRGRGGGGAGAGRRGVRLWHEEADVQCRGGCRHTAALQTLSALTADCSPPVPPCDRILSGSIL